MRRIQGSSRPIQSASGVQRGRSSHSSRALRPHGRTRRRLSKQIAKRCRAGGVAGLLLRGERRHCVELVLQQLVLLLARLRRRHEASGHLQRAGTRACSGGGAIVHLK